MQAVVGGSASRTTAIDDAVSAASSLPAGTVRGLRQSDSWRTPRSVGSTPRSVKPAPSLTPLAIMRRRLAGCDRKPCAMAPMTTRARVR